MNKESQGKIYVYIDGANLDKGTVECGWRIDYQKFFIWLIDKYHMDTAYIFIGYISKYEKLYSKMRKAGFMLVFKDVVISKGQIKGNCDTDLVLRGVKDSYEQSIKTVVLVSSDGDFAPLISFFIEKNIEIKIVSPRNACSFLLRKMNTQLSYLNNERNKIQLVVENTNSLP